MTQFKSIGDLQLAILRVLWTRKEASVTDVHAALTQTRNIAPTTVATMLKKMEQRKLVHYRRDGRRFIYAASVAEAELTHSMVSHLTKRLFDGNVKELVSHLIASHEIDANELEELTELIANAEKDSQGQDS